MNEKTLKNELLRKEQYAQTVDLFSSANTHVYLNDYLLPDAVSISYTLSYSKQPIYSYNSEYASKVTRGNVIIEGTLGIILTETAYFEIIRQSLMHYLKLPTYEESKKILEDQSTLIDDIPIGMPIRSHYTKYVKNTVNSEEYTNRLHVSKVEILHNKESKKGAVTVESPSVKFKTIYDYMGEVTDSDSNFENACERLEDQIWGPTYGIKKTGDLKYDNEIGFAVWDPLYDRIKNAMEMDYDVVKQGNQYVTKINYNEDNPLTLFIVYGDYNAPPAEHTVEALNDLHFTTKQIMVNNDGTPIIALYSFFATRLNGNVSTILSAYNEKFLNNPDEE